MPSPYSDGSEPSRTTAKLLCLLPLNGLLPLEVRGLKIFLISDLYLVLTQATIRPSTEQYLLAADAV